LFSRLAEHKYKFGIFALLLAASAVSVTLALFRMTRSDSLNYRFLVWNLILAWIPFLFASIAYASAITRKPIMFIVIFVCAIAWLVFFPNAPYILTDFQHLTVPDRQVPVCHPVDLVCLDRAAARYYFPVFYAGNCLPMVSSCLGVVLRNYCDHHEQCWDLSGTVRKVE
jgi:uncharacterized membrane protein